MNFTPVPQISSLHPYKPGLPIDELARRYNLDPSKIIKLASNENPLGPSPRAQEVIEKGVQNIHRYPDQHLLIDALSNTYNLHSSNIIIGNGSNDILDLIARVFLGSGFESISSQYAFIVYKIVTQLTGAKNVTVSAKEYGHDLPAMELAINKNTRVIWIANPNNPTGTFVPYQEIRRFLESIPPHIIVVLDEAYFEYLDDDQAIESTKWIQDFNNLIIVRTFSKIYGLAGLRAGYGIGSPQLIELLNRARQPFNMNGLAIEAATAALADTAFKNQSREQNKAGLQMLQQGLAKMGVKYIPSHGNFITVFTEDPMTTYERFLSQGIIVRPVTEYGLTKHLRVSVGTGAENRQFLSTWETLATKLS